MTATLSTREPAVTLAPLPNEAGILVKIENADAGLGGIEHPLVLIRAGHFALLASRALAGIDHQGFQHSCVSSAWPPLISGAPLAHAGCCGWQKIG